LAAAGHARRVILGDLLWGADTDADAVAVARAALRAWGAEDGADVDPAHVVVADPLALGAAGWPDAPPRGFAFVVGNPPFLSPLDTASPRAADHAGRLQVLAGSSVAPYADTATLFLLTACDLTGPGGRVAMILPESVLAARDAGPVRREVRRRAAVVGLWWAGEPVFAAGVQVCAPVLEVGAAQPARCALWRGRAFEAVASAPVDDDRLRTGASWAPLLARLRGAPDAALGDGPTLATVASATAGFREQFYGVIPYVAEASTRSAGARSAMAPLVTAGLIDPLRSRWGRTEARFGGSRWQAPVVDMERLQAGKPSLAGWGAERRVPKVVVATQTRVIEAAVDEDGSWWPSVPTIAVTPRSGGPVDLWSLAAVLSAPPVSAWALRHYGGTALSGDAIKLSAAQILTIPLPDGSDAWANGAAAARAAHRAGERGDALAWQAALADLGAAMCEAYGAPAEVLAWWSARLPPWR
ncbi:MAG TPA: hypothetical protein VIJ47_10065, partial [Acidimicrobiales bacterium]